MCYYVYTRYVRVRTCTPVSQHVSKSECNLQESVLPFHDEFRDKTQVVRRVQQVRLPAEPSLAQLLHFQSLISDLVTLVMR